MTVRYNVGWLHREKRWGWFVYHHTTPKHIAGTGGKADTLQDAYAMVYRLLDVDVLRARIDGHTSPSP